MRNLCALILVSMLVMYTICIVQFTTSLTSTATSHLYPDDFPEGSTLQQAINNENVSDGDSIIIRPGTYYEHLIVNRSLTIESFNRYTTMIDGSGNGTVISVTANDVNILQLTVQNGDPYGICLYRTNNNEVSHNIVNASHWGVMLSGCSNVIMTDNNIKDNTYNFGVSGNVSELATYNIDTTNEVDGRPIYYWKNHEHDGQTIPAGAGYVAVVNSTNVTVKGPLTLAKNGQGVLLAGATDSSIENLSISSNACGIDLLNSSGNLIAANALMNNKVGVGLSQSDRNTLIDNTVNDNIRGIILYRSNSSRIVENNVSNNHLVGIAVTFSENSRIVDNNICNNNLPVVRQYVSPAVELGNSKDNLVSGNTVSENGFIGIAMHYTENNSVWGNIFSRNGFSSGGVDNGFEIYIDSSNHSIFYRNNITPYSDEFTMQTGPIYVQDSHAISWNTTFEGNYWSAYSGGDLKGDGIGDIPYVIPMYNSLEHVDHHPLIVPWHMTRVFKVARGFAATADVVTSTNSTVANGIADPNQRDLVNFSQATMEITFIITSYENETCTVTISRDWFDGPFELQIDGIPITINPGDVVQNATHTTLYIAYEAGIHTIKIKGTKLTLVLGDIDNDGDVDIFDIVAAAGNYGYSQPP